MSGGYALAIHGGAGTIAQGGDEAPYHLALREAAAAGEAVLAAGGCALDAVVAAVVALEDCILFNAGRGSVYTADARHEMDASLMDGALHRAGSVAGVRTVRNPVLLARAVMSDGACVMMAGEGAERFARAQGFAVTPPEYFDSPARLAQLRRAQAGGAAVLDHDGAGAQIRQAAPSGIGAGVPARIDAASSQDSAPATGTPIQGEGAQGLEDAMATSRRPDATDGADFGAEAPIKEEGKFGTVGAVARDRDGNLASAVSTGGMTNKRPGRVGDTPIIGAGCYADNATVAVAATGTGEHFIRTVLAHDIAARMAYGGASLDAAARAAVMDKLTAIGGEGGVIAIDGAGRIAMPFNTSGMYRASVREGEPIESKIFL